ncbi:MAG: haloacid dehalogenase [Elusimicrobia bacterium RIFOXYB2_FULL_48_7]|nr:MAG: haloacid dehalogenase [Elusimicrobia bacterium RIFOXYB2_FULL_48_7]
MKTYSQDILKNLKPSKKFFVGIDSDGTAFPTMELKHKECFIPAIIKVWGLQAISKYARETAEWVNLYSWHRGVNRFIALVMVFDLLKKRPEVQKSKVKIPDLAPLKKFIDSGAALSTPSFEKAVKETGDPILAKSLEWTNDANTRIAEMVKGAYPYTGVRESLEKLSKSADVIIVSATPGEALEREWEEHDLVKYVSLIAGQELGSKKEHIMLASEGKYDKANVLMIGDAPGDMKAGKDNGALFFPINPGAEEESWELFYKEAMDKFLSGKYAGAYEKNLIEKFEKLLPKEPTWRQV